VTCHDWRESAAGAIAPLYAAERCRWATTLHWETRETWTHVETARRAGTLPGLVVEDESSDVGWTFQLLVRNTLQVGAVVSSTEQATGLLLDGILSSTEAIAASNILVFTLVSAPGLVASLEGRGFAVERYLHMECMLRDVAVAEPVGRAWDVRDIHQVATLMGSAYEKGHPTRPFARDDDPAAWLDYARQLTTTTGCGLFLPASSVVVPSEASARIVASVLTTAVGPETGHLAQVIVAPEARGAGLGRRVVSVAMTKLKAAGYERVTLLVGERNPVARALYRSLGFVETATFVSATIDQPRRFSSDVVASGGARTFL